MSVSNLFSYIAMQANHPKLLVAILTLGVFGIINTEMGVVGLIPLIAEIYNVSVAQAGWTVTLFAIAIAVCGPVTPVLFSRFNRKSLMLLCLSVFVASPMVSAFTDSFAVLLASRTIPAILHPVYVSMAFTVAAQSVPKHDSPKAIAKVFIGVSAGMVLGVPFASFIAGAYSYEVAMLFFALVNALVFALTFAFVPSMPATATVSHKEQYAVLKRTGVWYALAAVIFTNAATFGFFSYMADFLKSATLLDFGFVSLVLFVYGASNIVGNVLAGKLLVSHTVVTVRTTPWLIAAVLALIFVLQSNAWAMFAVIFVFGVLTGLSSNNSQYLMTEAASDAPEFANGLFLSAANCGTAVGTMFCGLFVSGLGVAYSVFGALICLVLAVSAVYLATGLTLKSKIGGVRVDAQAEAIRS